MAYTYYNHSLLNKDEPLARIDSSGGVRYYHADILGSIVALTNSSGGVTTQYNYSPFGVTQVIGTDSAGLTQPFRFTGREWDAETGMYYYRARYYAPDIGRFITEDPIRYESGDVNCYRYVGNNPINNVDPLGLMFVDDGNFAGLNTPNQVPGGSIIHIGAGGFITVTSVGAGAESGIALGSNGRVCFYTQQCVMLGAMSAGSGGLGLSVSLGSGELCSGETEGTAGFWFGGTGLFGEGSVSSDGAGRGFAGVGAGVGAGVQFCTTQYYCL